MDKETGKPVQSNGKDVTATAAFTPEKPSGSVSLTFTFDGSRVASEVLAFIAPENRGKYRSQVYMGNAHYLDMYTLTTNPKSLWYHAPVNGSRLEHLRLNLEQSLQASSKYVWIYGENSGKIIDWSDGYYAKRKTWEEVIPGLTETMMLAKDPERFSAMRKAELKEKGELKNLLPDIAPMRFESKGGVREFSSLETHDVSVKGVKPGESYEITFFADLRRLGYEDAPRPESARPCVVWKKDGEILAGKTVVMKVVDPKPAVWEKVTATVTVRLISRRPCAPANLCATIRASISARTARPA